MSSFSQWRQLNDDLMMHVISYAADAPFELPHQRSALTHVLPLVCRDFHAKCRSEYLWKRALERLVRKDPDLWQVGLLKLLPRNQRDQIPPNVNQVVYVHDQIEAASYQDVYRRIVSTHIRVEYPVFCMNGHVQLNEPFGLHFFEPRYRLLIAEVMRDFPPEARQGNTIHPNQAGEMPTFCYAHVQPFAPTSPACLVHVRNCHMHADGTADVFLVPVSYVWLERMWERPNTGRLYQAQCIRMGNVSTRQMEERAFRERERMQQGAMFGHPGFVQQMLQLILMREPMGNRGENNAENDEAEGSEEDEAGEGMDLGDRLARAAARDFLDEEGEESDGDGEEYVD
jgi:hypothetical protein